MSDEARTQGRPQPGDRRVQRTRAAIRTAFNALILTRGYQEISAADIAEKADVGRSTFYEHFQSKDDVLAQSLGVLLDPMARACRDQGVTPQLMFVVEHFWDNRRLAKALMSGRAHEIIARLLTQQIENELRTQFRASPGHEDTAPLALLAGYIAHGQLALLEAWLSGRHGSSATQIAICLQTTSCAAVVANLSRD